MMANNPLAAERPQRPAPEDPMLKHAQIWKHMHGQPSDDLQAHVQTLDYGLPILGALASNPKTTAKDVIKAVSAAVADQKLSPSKGVAMIAEMPADADKLKPWLRERYAMNLTAAVHAKAALMAQAEQPRGHGLMLPQQAPDPTMMGRPA